MFLLYTYKYRNMNYIVRLIACLIFLLVIYEGFKILAYQKKIEKFLGYSMAINKNKMEIDKKKREEAYTKLGIPDEWYKFKNKGYSYLDPKYWNVPQHYQPVCYDEDDVSPSPIMSPGTSNALFYNPGKNNKHVNKNMKFEIKPEIIYKTTIYTRTSPYAEVGSS